MRSRDISLGELELTPEEIRHLITTGESQSLEFKSSLRYDSNQGGVNRELTKVIAKTLAGFLNASGGTLLIGVSDNGKVVGIERDIETLSKRNLDGFELTLRNAVSNYLGVGVGPTLGIQFADLDERVLAVVDCARYPEPIFLRDGERQSFFIRDGNQTRPLDVRATHEYIRRQWPPELREATETIRDVLVQAVREELARGPGSDEQSLQAEVGDLTALRVMGDRTDQPVGLVEEGLTASVEAEALVREAVAEAGTTALVPPLALETSPVWMRVATHRVIDLFLRALAGSRAWKRLFIVSPWISKFDLPASISFDQMVARLILDDATAYVITRPPEEDWHAEAIECLGQSGRANVALVPDLHVKLYTALTAEGSFAMLGSANFTSKSLVNREIGLLVTSYAEGKGVIATLNREASEIYRLRGRSLTHKASFSARRSGG